MPLLPSAFDALAIDTVGATTTASSLVMVPVAVAVPSLAPEGAESVTVNVSSGSTVASPVTATLIVLDVSPAANVKVPVDDVVLTRSGCSVGGRVLDRYRRARCLRQGHRERHVRCAGVTLRLRRVADRHRRLRCRGEQGNSICSPWRCLWRRCCSTTAGSGHTAQCVGVVVVDHADHGRTRLLRHVELRRAHPAEVELVGRRIEVDDGFLPQSQVITVVVPGCATAAAAAPPEPPSKPPVRTRFH